jgi:UDP:flavonoid glycosyltransferase YjiC (YdhE family)
VFDQHYWGERIAELGVGPKPIRYKELTTERSTGSLFALVLATLEYNKKPPNLGKRFEQKMELKML